MLRKYFVKFCAVSISIAMSIFFIEIACLIYTKIYYGTIDITEIMQKRVSNKYITDMIIKAGSYEKTLFPHPYLAHVHNKKYGGQLINNIGMPDLGRDMPFAKDEKYFTILVTGGSVASQFIGQARPQRYLEKKLNARYDFGGKTVRIVCGASGAWKQPQQAIFFLLYSHIIDAVITIDGFNEHYAFFPGSNSLEIPSPNYWVVNPLLSGGENRVTIIAIDTYINRLATSSFIFSNSCAAYLIARNIGDIFISKLIKRAKNYNEYNDFGLSTYSIFALPSDMDTNKKFIHNINLYKKYIRSMLVISKDMCIKTAFFIQPAPAIGKILTENEKKIVGSLNYKDIYQRMTEELLNLKHEEVPIFSLLNLFSDVEDDIYADAVHFIRDNDEVSRGNEMMAEAIATILETEWNLQRK
jgi:hypothetical protein